MDKSKYGLKKPTSVKIRNIKKCIKKMVALREIDLSNMVTDRKMAILIGSGVEAVVNRVVRPDSKSVIKKCFKEPCERSSTEHRNNYWLGLKLDAYIEDVKEKYGYTPSVQCISKVIGEIYSESSGNTVGAIYEDQQGVSYRHIIQNCPFTLSEEDKLESFASILATFCQFTIISEKDYAHKASGDVRVDNLCATAKGTVIMIDFSRGVGEEMTSGDPFARYHPPESIAGKLFYFDVFGIGATLYLLMTGNELGNILEDEDKFQEQMSKIEKIEKMGPEMSKIIKKMLRPENFFNSLEDLRFELKDFLNIFMHETGRGDLDWDRLVSSNVAKMALETLRVVESFMLEKHGDQMSKLEHFEYHRNYEEDEFSVEESTSKAA